MDDWVLLPIFLLAGLLFVAATTFFCVRCIANGAPWWMSLYALITVVLAFAALNWLLFHGLAPILGGFAQNGRISDSQYFLGNHGNYVPVARGRYLFMWSYKEWSDRIVGSAFVLFLLASVGFERLCRRHLSRSRTVT